MKFLKRLTVAALILIIIGIVTFNVKLFYDPSFETYGTCQVNKGLVSHLAHLKDKLHNGAAEDMQGIYPEGFVFLNALYGLSWLEVSEFLPEDNELYQEAHEEINWVLTELSSEQGISTFNSDLNPEYGIFYKGWANYLLGRKLKQTPREDWDSSEVHQFSQNCFDIIEAINDRNSPYLESYRRACWPADMTVGVASVAIHEELFPGTYRKAIVGWLERVESTTDELGLISHSSNCENGGVIESSRGSSQSLILNFLIDIDEEYANQKFKKYKEAFLDYRLGLPGIREYPKGTKGNGDIDSGPVIWGIGGASSIVGQRVMTLYGEDDVAIGLRNSIDAFGLGKSYGGKKNYLFGVLPIADAFIAWSNSAEAYESEKMIGQKNWRIKVQLLSLVLLLMCLWLIFRLIKK